MKRLNNISFKKNELTLLISSLLLINTSVGAEENTETQAKNRSTMEVIEVTARKKIESIQNVPMSVNAVTGKHIENMGINDIEDLSAIVPGLEQPKLAIQSRLSLRGVSSGDNTSFEQSVGTYVDGIYRGRMNQQRAGFFDMERVEVLKGPQVTLYGNSSIGGAISMITKRPELDSEITGNITVKYGVELEQSQFIGGLNIPVTDEFAVRIAGQYRDQEKGAVFNNYSAVQDYVPKAKDDALRVGAYWEATNDLAVYLRYEQGNFETIGNNLDPLIHLNPDYSDKTDSALIALGMGDDELFIGNGAPFTNGGDGGLVETEETMLELVYSFDDSITLTSITGSSSYDYTQVYDVDVTPLTIIDTAQDESYEQFSQELRLSVTVNEQLDYLVGVYYQDDDFKNDYFADFNVPLILSLKTGLPEAFVGSMISPFSRHANLDQKTEQIAIFGQVDYALTDKWNVTLGALYTENEKTADQSVLLADMVHNDDPAMGGIRDFGWLVGQPPGIVQAPDYYMGYQLIAPGSAPHQFTNMVRKEEHAMFQAGVKYQATSDLMYYVSWANGAKSGGFDILFEGANEEDAEFEDEEANTFEIGFKRDWQDVRLNVGAFYGEYENLQVSVFNGSVGFNVGNAATTIQQGIDAELIWVVTDNLTLSANAEYLDFTYDKFEGGVCSFSEDPNKSKGTCDWSNKELPWVPKFKSLISAEHIWEVSPIFEMINMLSISYKSEHTTSSDNEALTKQDGYALVDYRATLAAVDSGWHIALTVSNLFDENYELYTSQIPLNDGAFAHVLHEGREITIEVGFQF